MTAGSIWFPTGRVDCHQFIVRHQWNYVSLKEGLRPSIVFSGRACHTTSEILNPLLCNVFGLFPGQMNVSGISCTTHTSETASAHFNMEKCEFVIKSTTSFKENNWEYVSIILESFGTLRNARRRIEKKTLLSQQTHINHILQGEVRWLSKVTVATDKFTEFAWTGWMTMKGNIVSRDHEQMTYISAVTWLFVHVLVSEKYAKCKY